MNVPSWLLNKWLRVATWVLVWGAGFAGLSTLEFSANHTARLLGWIAWMVWVMFFLVMVTVHYLGKRNSATGKSSVVPKPSDRNSGGVGR